MSTAAMRHHRLADTHAGEDVVRHKLERALADLRGAVTDVIGAIIASVDGLPMAHNVRNGDPSSIAAMAATAAGLGKRIVDDFDFGRFAECVVRAEGGYFVVYSVGRVGVLAVMASEGANLGRVHLAARRCATTVAGALEGGSS
jgi:predicted regulator of Ras-like GTPase activity (Roadblock/LC7/MglB family)